jgi:hypothetical protein
VKKDNVAGIYFSFTLHPSPILGGLYMRIDIKIDLEVIDNRRQIFCRQIFITDTLSHHVDQQVLIDLPGASTNSFAITSCMYKIPEVFKGEKGQFLRRNLLLSPINRLLK